MTKAEQDLFKEQQKVILELCKCLEAIHQRLKVLEERNIKGKTVRPVARETGKLVNLTKAAERMIEEYGQ